MIILRGQPNFYGQRFSRYEILTNLTPFWLNFGIWALFDIFGTLRLSERYIYPKTTIVNESCDHCEGSTDFYGQRFSRYEVLTNLTAFWLNFGPVVINILYLVQFWAKLGYFGLKMAAHPGF